MALGFGYDVPNHGLAAGVTLLTGIARLSAWRLGSVHQLSAVCVLAGPLGSPFIISYGRAAATAAQAKSPRYADIAVMTVPFV